MRYANQEGLAPHRDLTIKAMLNSDALEIAVLKGDYRTIKVLGDIAKNHNVPIDDMLRRDGYRVLRYAVGSPSPGKWSWLREPEHLVFSRLRPQSYKALSVLGAANGVRMAEVLNVFTDVIRCRDHPFLSGNAPIVSAETVRLMGAIAEKEGRLAEVLESIGEEDFRYVLECCASSRAKGAYDGFVAILELTKQVSLDALAVRLRFDNFAAFRGVREYASAKVIMDLVEDAGLLDEMLEAAKKVLPLVIPWYVVHSAGTAKDMGRIDKMFAATDKASFYKMLTCGRLWSFLREDDRWFWASLENDARFIDVQYELLMFLAFCAPRETSGMISSSFYYLFSWLSDPYAIIPQDFRPAFKQCQDVYTVSSLADGSLKDLAQDLFSEESGVAQILFRIKFVRCLKTLQKNSHDENAKNELNAMLDDSKPMEGLFERPSRGALARFQEGLKGLEMSM